MREPLDQAECGSTASQGNMTTLQTPAAHNISPAASECRHCNAAASIKQHECSISARTGCASQM